MRATDPYGKNGKNASVEAAYAEAYMRRKAEEEKTGDEGCGRRTDDSGEISASRTLLRMMTKVNVPRLILASSTQVRESRACRSKNNCNYKNTLQATS